jgi:hypothetical protein
LFAPTNLATPRRLALFILCPLSRVFRGCAANLSLLPAAVLPWINCALQIGIATILLSALSIVCPHGDAAAAAERRAAPKQQPRHAALRAVLRLLRIPCRCLGATLRWMGRASYAILLLHGAPLRYLLYPHRATDAPSVYLRRCGMFLAWVFALAHCVTEYVAPPAERQRAAAAAAAAAAATTTAAAPGSAKAAAAAAAAAAGVAVAGSTALDSAGAAAAAEMGKHGKRE